MDKYEQNAKNETTSFYIEIKHYTGSTMTAASSERVDIVTGLDRLAELYVKYSDNPNATFVDALDNDNKMHIVLPDMKDVEIGFPDYIGKCPYKWYDAKAYALTKGVDNKIPDTVDDSYDTNEGIDNEYGS